MDRPLERPLERPLSGLKVLDFSSTIAGPHCARLLADLGADVVKIEPPEGDTMRLRMPLRAGASSFYGQLNAGKRSMVLDLKRPHAVAAVHRLAAGADVLVENYRPGVMTRLGLDHPALRRTNERLIYCAISGYGQTGPSSHLPAYAPVIHAASGYDLAHLTYQGDRIAPDNCGIFVADVLAGTYAFGAIMTALRHRDTTGQGQLVDVSMLESMLSLTLVELQGAQFALPPPPRRPVFGPVATEDGFILVAVASERTFQSLAQCCGAGWLEDPRFAAFTDRRANWGALMDELESWTRPRPTTECLACLERHGVPASAYRTVREAMADPQLAHREALAEVEDSGGVFQALKPPFRLSAAAIETGPRAAALGEHTADILAEAGLSPQEIATLTS